MCFSISLSAKSQRLVPAITWNTHCQLWLSVRCTIPRNNRRLVRTLNNVGERISSRWASLAAWSFRITSSASRAYASPRWVSNRLSQYEWPRATVLDVNTSWRGTKKLCAMVSAARWER